MSQCHTLLAGFVLIVLTTMGIMTRSNAGFVLCFDVNSGVATSHLTPTSACQDSGVSPLDIDRYMRTIAEMSPSYL